ncbi:uncharacterized protein BDR25DRAFT_305169 [Lindgomyces ingoldianus]|uniref:Uncharacterized protein n=1 Tax=Lindgomyces ingoldianus TaxID=673940 RepID=A0ACB6QMK7_9PLEO|nr:uncharacterized protein BDR25DRAFT_305169 [Lindgomyces ingoldianus]KAF2468168.1 hypothetical protein BDR25DRAFT_305169 [Lindgomyces ingoldianus]
MKSWNKKDWVKTADICQMLYVLGQVKDEEEAKKFSLPREVEPSSHQYAHGLTPPMHWVRKRRFRPRVSYRRIEEVEATVDALLDDDAKASADGGKCEYQVLDADKLNSDEDTSSDESEEDEEVVEAQYMEGETPAAIDPEAEEVDANDLEKMMAAEFEEDDLFGGGIVDTPATSHDVALHALGETAIPTTESPGSNPETESADDDDDDDDDAESDEEVVDEVALAAQRDQDQTREEIKELEKEIAAAWEQHNRTGNIPFQKKIKQKIERLTQDLNVKKSTLGDEVD